MDITQIEGQLSNNPLFASLDASILHAIAETATEVSYKLGDTLLRKGGEGDGLYIIVKGRVRVVDDSNPAKTITLAVLKDGAQLGERSLLFGEPVSATVRAASTVTLIKFPKPAFDAMLLHNPELRAELEAVSERQADFNLLKTQPLLAGLNPKETQSLLEEIERIELRTDGVLFREGDPGDSMFIVKSGSLAMIKESENDLVLGLSRAGDLIGEMALIYNQPRASTAFAAEPTSVFKVTRDVFERIAGAKEDIAELIAQYAANRLLQTQSLVRGQQARAERDFAEPGSEIRVGAVKVGLFTRLPLVMTDNPDLGGLACLKMAAEFFKQPLDHERLEEQQRGAGPDDLYSVGRKAESAGLMSRLIKIEDSDLDGVTMPAMFVRKDGTPAMLYRVSRSSMLIADPARGITRIKRKEFLEEWNHELLTLAYVPDFGNVGTNLISVYARFIPLFRPYLGLLLKILGVSLLLQVFNLMPPLFTKILIDDVLVVGDWHLLQLMLVGLVVVTFLTLVVDALQDFMTLHLTRRVSGTLFVRFFAHTLALPIAVLNKWQTGELTNRFDENEKILEKVQDGGIAAVANLITLLVYFPIMFTINVKLALVTTPFVIVLFTMMVLLAPKVRRFEILDFEASSAQESHLIETVQSIATIKSMGKEDEFAKKGLGFFGRNMKIDIASEKLDNKIEIATEFLEEAHKITLLAVGAHFVIQGQLTAGLLIAFTSVAGQVLDAGKDLANFYDDWLELKVSLERVNDVLDSPRESGDAQALAPRFNGHIRFENVSFAYEEGGPKILKNISLEIQPGQKVAFVGRSGSGKSTLAMLVNRLLEPTEGLIFIDDIDISGLDLASLRRQIGVVEQSPFIFSGTIRQNISLANPNLSLEGIVSAATLAGMTGFIENLPMRFATKIGEGGRSLSGGQSQRLTIARALAGDPSIMILDEATSALDNESERLIQANLDRAMEGRTSLVIAHRLSTIRNADVIVVLDEGEIVEQGTHESLLEEQGVYSYLHSKAEE